MIIFRILYGLKYSIASWRANLTEPFNSMGYQSIELDPDVWFKRDAKPSVEDYYKYMIGIC